MKRKVNKVNKKRINPDTDKKYRIDSLTATPKYNKYSDILKALYRNEDMISLNEADQAIQNHLNRVVE